jgi:hypothetical protein
MVFPPGGVDTAPAQTAPSGSQLLASSGTPGTFSATSKVGRCRYTNTGGTWQTAIELPAPAVSPHSGIANQRISWEPRLYQVIAGIPAVQFLQSGDLQSSAASAGTVNFTTAHMAGLPQGPAYVTGGRITWFSDDVEIGAIEFIFTTHDSFIGTTQRIAQNLLQCSQVAPAEMSLSTYRTTVNVTVHITGRYFPISAPVNITWNGKTIKQTTSDAQGNVSTSIPVPAAPLGTYQLGLDAGTIWRPDGLLTVVPRIKVIPGEAERGETVKISLRGFAKKESVRIRWLRDGQWVEIGWISTSNTGSGELWIAVPAWAADGQHSVRGDGPNARAQTNAVTITGGPPVVLASEEPTPLPATPEPVVDPVPATPAPAETPPPADSGTPVAVETPPNTDAPNTAEPVEPATPEP